MCYPSSIWSSHSIPLQCWVRGERQRCGHCPLPSSMPSFVRGNSCRLPVRSGSINRLTPFGVASVRRGTSTVQRRANAWEVAIFQHQLPHGRLSSFRSYSAQCWWPRENARRHPLPLCDFRRGYCLVRLAGGLADAAVEDRLLLNAHANHHLIGALALCGSRFSCTACVRHWIPSPLISNFIIDFSQRRWSSTPSA